MSNKDQLSTYSTSDKVSSLVDKIKKDEAAKGKRITLFYSGKELIHDHQIGQYIKEDAVVIVYLRPIPLS